jgi:D-Tyr-tRNAtyr deacylase
VGNCAQNKSVPVLTKFHIVSQFTLLASTKKSKPDFHGALGGEQAKELYQLFVSKIQQGYKPERVKDGVFQAMMVRLFEGTVFVYDLTNWAPGSRLGQ